MEKLRPAKSYLAEICLGDDGSKGGLFNVLDQSISSLRELQDEGDPDIVAEVGWPLSPALQGKVRARRRQKKAMPGLSTWQHAASSPAAPKSGPCASLALAKDLEMMARSCAWRGP